MEPSRVARSAMAFSGAERFGDQNSASWNRVTSWLRFIEAVRQAA